MKRIVDGKRYDTETATLIDETQRCKGDFRDYREALYRTRTGRWFLEGEGGPMSRWAQGEMGAGGCWAGEGLEPVSAEEAREWLEAVESWDALEQYFDIQDA